MWVGFARCRGRVPFFCVKRKEPKKARPDRLGLPGSRVITAIAFACGQKGTTSSARSRDPGRLPCASRVEWGAQTARPCADCAEPASCRLPFGPDPLAPAMLGEPDGIKPRSRTNSGLRTALSQRLGRAARASVIASERGDPVQAQHRSPTLRITKSMHRSANGSPVWSAEHRSERRIRPRSGTRQDGESAQSAHGRAVCAPRRSREAQGTSSPSAASNWSREPTGTTRSCPYRRKESPPRAAGRANQGTLSLVTFFSCKRKSLARDSGRNPTHTSQWNPPRITTHDSTTKPPVSCTPCMMTTRKP